MYIRMEADRENPSQCDCPTLFGVSTRTVSLILKDAKSRIDARLQIEDTKKKLWYETPLGLACIAGFFGLGGNFIAPVWEIVKHIIGFH